MTEFILPISHEIALSHFSLIGNGSALLEEAQAGIKVAGRNVTNLRHADDTTLMAERDEELKPLDESESGE